MVDCSGVGRLFVAPHRSAGYRRRVLAVVVLLVIVFVVCGTGLCNVPVLPRSRNNITPAWTNEKTCMVPNEIALAKDSK
jgi:lipopolysaccharide export LptBFGC system permease protein LptF